MREKLVLAMLALTAGGCRGVLDLEEATYVAPDADVGATDAFDSGVAEDSSAPSDSFVSDSETLVDSGNVTDGLPADGNPSGPPGVAILMAAPDLPPQFICFASFAHTGDPTPQLGVGPFGGASGLAYGASTVENPQLDWRDSTVVAWISGSKPTDCASAWSSSIRANHQVTLPPGSIRPGESWAIAVFGCQGGGTEDACGAAGNNLAVVARNFGDPSTLAGGAFGLAILDLSFYDSTNIPPQGDGGLPPHPPSWSPSLDAWLVPFNSGTQGTTTEVAKGAAPPTGSSTGGGATDPITAVTSFAGSQWVLVVGPHSSSTTPDCVVPPGQNPSGACQDLSFPWDKVIGTSIIPGAGKHYVVAVAGAPVGTPTDSFNTVKFIAASLDP